MQYERHNTANFPTFEIMSQGNQAKRSDQKIENIKKKLALQHSIFNKYSGFVSYSTEVFF